MVGQRGCNSKTRPSLTLEAVVPRTNFYRRVKQILHLDFLYEEVKPYYGQCGQTNGLESSGSTSARLAQKANKPLRLYYSATMAVDTSDVLRHLILM
jgi:hypothetical protein